MGGKFFKIMVMVVMAGMACGGGAMAQPEAADSVVAGEGGRYESPLMKPQAFDFEALGMIEGERREYAENMAVFALVLVANGHADAEGVLRGVPQAKFDMARKLIGLAYHLEPRSRVAVVANGRLKAGVVGKKPLEAGMAAETFASLLVGRAAELRKEGGADNIRLAGCFLDLAAAMDPSSDDAIYAFEMYKMDGLSVDWKGILGGE